MVVTQQEALPHIVDASSCIVYLCETSVYRHTCQILVAPVPVTSGYLGTQIL